MTGVVLAAGRSSRLGTPKQLLAYRGRTLLDAALDVAKASALDQVVVALGGAADDVRDTVDLSGLTVVDNVHHAAGCSSSIVAALRAVDARADAIVLLLGDQPGVLPSTIDGLRDACAGARAPVGVCRYDDGRGHPFWFDRSMFAALEGLHGDKAVWKLLESDRWPVTEFPVAGEVPIDVDTWDDYRNLIGQGS